MNIWIFNHYASSLSLGGAETRHVEFGEAFSSKGHKVRIFVGSFSHLTEDNMCRFCTPIGSPHSGDSPSFHCFETRRYESNGLDRFLSSIDYCKSGRRTLGASQVDRPDVVIASSPHPYAWRLGWEIAERYGAKLVVEIRDVWPRDLISAGKLSRMNPVSVLFGAVEKKAYLKATKIVSLLPNLEAHICQVTRRNIEDRVVYIPNGIDASRFEKPKITSEVADLMRRFQSKRVIAYLGSHGPTNDLETVLRGVKLLNIKNASEDLQFAFIGRGSEKSNLIDLAKELSLDNVVFLDQIPKESVPGLIQSVDALIFPLAKFDMQTPAVSSYKLLDYMASGKPIVAADLPGLPLKITGEGEFYEPGSPDSFSEALTRLLRSLNEGPKKCLKNISYVRDNRDIKKLAEQYEKTLKEG
jgi:glycosyltransferase involved in cell wall biosynthesis